LGIWGRESGDVVFQSSPFNFKTKVGLAEGLRREVAWYRQSSKKGLGCQVLTFDIITEERIRDSH